MSRRILVLAPHTDDGEFGAGATIAKMVEKGDEAFYIAFSIAEESVPDGYPKDILKTEVRLATNELGIKEENLIIKNYKVRYLNFSRQQILEDLVQLKKEIKPDIIFMPSVNDVHQDHDTVAREGLRAFKSNSILCYEIPWNNLSFNNQCLVELEERHIERKVQALMHYRSQSFRSYASEEFIRSLATTRGMLIGKEYAEAFEVVRWIL